MKATEALTTTLGSTQFLLTTYLSDLSDADFFVRPLPEMNHIAWQVGHLIDAEGHLMAQVPGSSAIPLPPGFSEAHSTKRATEDKSDDHKGYLNKAAYLELFDKVRKNTIATVSALSDSDLDKPTTGNMAKFAPTLGALVVMVSNHTMMHAGQFVAVRRKLGKPILI